MFKLKLSRFLPKISIRYKLLILLCLLATTVLSIFLVFSTKLFEKDKSVYIFDSSATYSRSIATQIRSGVNFTTEKINIMMAGLKEGGRTLDEASLKLFKEDQRIKALVLVSSRVNENEPDKNRLIELSKEDSSISKGEEESLITQIKMNKIAFFPTSKEGIYNLGFIYSSEGEETVYVLVTFESPDLKMAFEASQSFASYLIDQSGEMIMKSDNISNDRIYRFINSTYFNKISKNKVPEGTGEVKTPDGDFLVSYNRVGFGDLMVISEIDKKDAFKTMDILLIKSALFFVALLSLSVIFSVIFSNSLTYALSKLAEAVRNVSEGNFDINVQVNSRDEVGELAEGFNIMTEKISKLLRELQLYSEQLESMVDERTKDLREANNFIKTMINSLGQGLLVFDKEGKCLPVYTQACVEIFKEEPRDRFIWDVLKIAENKLEGFKKWIDSMFKQMIPFKDMAKLGPSSVAENNQQFISLQYQPLMEEKVSKDEELTSITRTRVPIGAQTTEEEVGDTEDSGEAETAETLDAENTEEVNENETEETSIIENPEAVEATENPENKEAEPLLKGIVLVATDKTQEHLAKLEAQRNQDHVSMITKLIRNKDQFLSFIKDAKNIMDQLNDLVIAGEQGTFDIKNTKLMLHSLKGSAGVYSLSELQKTVHEYETELDKHKDDSPLLIKQYLPTLKNQILNLRVIFQGYSEQFKVFLGESILDGKYRVELKHDQLVVFADKLKQQGSNSPLYKEFIEEFVKVPIVNFFKGYSDLVVELSKRKGKEMNPLVFQGGDLRILKDHYSELFTTMVHVFTNSVDHGLEVPEEREAAAKSRAGTVMVSFFKQSIQNQEALKIVVQDDGKGIDPKRIRNKLISNGVHPSTISSDDFEVIQHVFDDNFSTADQVSLTSGRGVGLGALKSACEKLGGAVNVSSVAGKGSRFMIVVPFV